MSHAKSQFTINEVIAFNLARARRRKGWTQEETAEKLTEVMGRRWTKGTLGPAERSWETDRVREFNGDELAAFCLVFDQPLAYFLLPPDGGEKDHEYRAGPQGKTISHLDWLGLVLPLWSSNEFLELANVATRKHGLSWAPAQPGWYRIEEHGPEDGAPEGDTAEAPTGGAVVDEAKRRRVLELLTEIRRLLAPEEFPPF